MAHLVVLGFESKEKAEQVLDLSADLAKRESLPKRS
jgi:uncharacterized membrane protein